MIKFSLKKVATAFALSMTLALTVPAVLPLATSTNVVTVEAASAKLSKNSATLLTGQTLKLTVSNKGKNKVKWSTSKSKVATVKDGKVTAVGKGTATISAKVGKKTLKCKVSVIANELKGERVQIKDVKNGITDFYPYSVYYKNGKLYCKADFVNKSSNKKKITKITNLKKKDQLKMSLTARVYTSPVAYNDIPLAEGTIKKGLPTNISYKNKKSVTIEFSGKQIKKKGFDLTKADSVLLKTDSFYYWFKR